MVAFRLISPPYGPLCMRCDRPGMRLSDLFSLFQRYFGKKMDSLLCMKLAEIVHLNRPRKTATLRRVVEETMTAERDSKGLHEVVPERAARDGTCREVAAGNPVCLGTAMKAVNDIRTVRGAESPRQV